MSLLLGPGGLGHGLGVELRLLQQLISLLVGHLRDQLRNIHSFLLLFQPPIHFGGNLAMAAVQIVSRARLGGKPPVNCHILLFHLADQGFVSLPQQFLDPISPADIRQ